MWYTNSTFVIKNGEERDSCLIKKEEIIVWRRHYLGKFLDPRPNCVENLASYLLPYMKKQKTIITHIGSSDGFLEEGSLLIE